MSRAMREDDSPDLFGHGSGGATEGNISCDWCGTYYTDRESTDGQSCWGDSIGFTMFGSKQVLDCCWEEVERAVLNRIGDILPWYRKILDRREALLTKRREQLEAVTAPAETAPRTGARR